ncbi:hypothetical protein [Bradyrhizobium sp. Ash2021]|uniref:hypothetical protein n=1 Tax=Bradyrhizobium sp. Ash2021 TaxID=2954771 RepID=UPI002815B1CA|nr:hypothetical protein [Bradyrhizobium sp. Ash2021]WMT79722.1 hypothetical protein NL528_45500 [Bradyrhizobium sp. Ash2021]
MAKVVAFLPSEEADYMTGQAINVTIDVLPTDWPQGIEVGVISCGLRKRRCWPGSCTTPTHTKFRRT